MTAQVVRSIQRMGDIEPTIVYFDVDDYRTFHTWHPKNVWKNRFEAAFCIREKIKETDPAQYDYLFLHGFELMYGLSEHIQRIPAALLTDSTDVLSHGLLAQQNGSSAFRLKTFLKDSLTKSLYRPIIRNFDAIMPITEWCAQSFRDEYGVASEKIVMTHGGFDINHWKPAQSPRKPGKARLLFVGNDLKRKGIYFLLKTYSGALQDRCELTIVSTDPLIHSLPVLPGVTYIPGVENSKLVDVYASCDLFVFPTYKDMCPNVLKEAAATGLPIISRDVGAIGEIVQDGANGYLMPYISDEAAWGGRIAELVEDEARMSSFREKSRALAVALFSEDKFDRELRRVFEMLERSQKIS